MQIVRSELVADAHTANGDKAAVTKGPMPERHVSISQVMTLSFGADWEMEIGRSDLGPNVNVDTVV